MLASNSLLTISVDLDHSARDLMDAAGRRVDHLARIATALNFLPPPSILIPFPDHAQMLVRP
jgi:hypothetical protein